MSTTQGGSVKDKRNLPRRLRNWVLDFLRVHSPPRVEHADFGIGSLPVNSLDEHEAQRLIAEMSHSAVLKEFEILHKQIEKTIGEIAATERWTIVGIAGVWSFLLHPVERASTPPDLPSWAWSIPFFLAVAGVLKVLALYYDYGVMSSFIFDRIEPKSQLRWESYTLAKGNHLWGRGIYPYALWGGLLFVSFFAWNWKVGFLQASWYRVTGWISLVL